jgi:hypothetical protein
MDLGRKLKMQEAKPFVARWISLSILTTVVLASGFTRIEAHSQTTALGTAATYTVQGVVLNKATGQPMVRALVESESEAAFTDKEGRFSLPMRAGSASLGVARPGYGDVSGSPIHSFTVIENTPEQIFYLTPQAEIDGHVTVADGGQLDDLGGVGPGQFFFRVYKKSMYNGKPLWQRIDFATLDSEGQFRLQNLETPTSYLLCNSPKLESGRLTKQGAVEYGFPEACFPGGEVFDAATPLSLRIGQKADLEISLTKQPFYPVTIEALNLPQGAWAIPGLYAQGGGSSIDALASQDMNGAMTTYKLPNGSYTVEEQAWSQGSGNSDGQSVPLFAQIDFTVHDGPVTGLKLNFQPQRPVTVEIRKEYTVEKEASSSFKPSSGLADQAPVQLTWTPVAKTFDSPPINEMTRAPGGDDENQYEVSGLRPGRYWVRAGTQWASGSYISSITSGGHDLTEAPLTVSAGATAPIEIVLRNDGGEILCAVNDPNTSVQSQQNGVNQYFIYVVPLSAETRASMTNPDLRQSTQENGVTYFRYPELAPGSYSVAAFDSRQEYDFFDAETLARLAEKGKTVTVTAGAKVKVQVDLIHTNTAEEAK